MFRHYFPMWSIACKPTIWNWRNWCTCIWWIMQNLNRIWLSWPSIHSSRFVCRVHLSIWHTVYFHEVIFILNFDKITRTTSGSYLQTENKRFLQSVCSATQIKTKFKMKTLCYLHTIHGTSTRKVIKIDWHFIGTLRSCCTYETAIIACTLPLQVFFYLPAKLQWNLIFIPESNLII